MSTVELVRKIKFWTNTYGFNGEVVSRREADNYVVEFTVRTTKTRASSIVTRLEGIVNEITGFTASVGKELKSEPPASRSDLATWRVFVVVPTRRSLAA